MMENWPLNPKDLKICAIAAPWRRGVEIAAFTDRYEAKVEFVEHSGVYDLKPMMGLSLEQAQTLMDDLWACGLRPTEGSGSAGAMGAVQEHLKDLRRLLFDDTRTQPK